MEGYKLSHYNYVIRLSDLAQVPDDIYNRDWVIYQQWLADGGVPLPADEEHWNKAPASKV